ncbi:hypothetical protein PIGHUM_02116 [Pigmentiphaga humi]|uniref:Nucleotidyltransferase n=1 Tax=Pigmentiphaga humi TaxID=2478468 RepID=A0A3P4B190_9BURK|nr:nucleotidyltransferase family protein [Pigmentiphaga humi]VCU70049.1 hypothetical protein PIGHUM_02116 [Pigmentiphaga humi]
MTAFTSRQVLQDLLLDMLSETRAVGQDRIDALSQADWDAVLSMAREHRIVPLLDWQLRRVHGHLHLPEAFGRELVRLRQSWTMRLLALQRELVLVHRLLAQAGIPHMALKGACLAWHAYPHPALRTMRDLDILVPMDRAVQAYRALLDGGLTRIDVLPGHPEAALDEEARKKHLPGLRTASGTALIELHVRLFHPETGPDARADLSESPDFWQRVRTWSIGSDQIPMEGATDLLLHLIVHTVYEHEFNNGPLLLSDIAFLLRTAAIDWPLFWRLAAQRRHTRGCALALQLTQRYWNVGGIDWRGAGSVQVSGQQLDLAALLMLRSYHDRSEVAFQAGVAGRYSALGKLRFVLGRVFLPRARLAARYPAHASSWRIYLWYFAYWRLLMKEWLPRLWQARRESSLRGEVNRLVAFRTWLQE